MFFLLSFLLTLFSSNQTFCYKRHMYLLFFSAINGPNLGHIIESIHLALTTSLWPRGSQQPEISGDSRHLFFLSFLWISFYPCSELPAPGALSYHYCRSNYCFEKEINSWEKGFGGCSCNCNVTFQQVNVFLSDGQINCNDTAAAQTKKMEGKSRCLEFRFRFTF